MQLVTCNVDRIWCVKVFYSSSPSLFLSWETMSDLGKKLQAHYFGALFWLYFGKQIFRLWPNRKLVTQPIFSELLLHCSRLLTDNSITSERNKYIDIRSSLQPDIPDLHQYFLFNYFPFQYFHVSIKNVCDWALGAFL